MGNITVEGLENVNYRIGRISQEKSQQQSLSVLSSPTFIPESLRLIYGVSVNAGTPMRVSVLKSNIGNGVHKAFTKINVTVLGQNYPIGLLVGRVSREDLWGRRTYEERGLGPKQGDIAFTDHLCLSGGPTY